MIALVPALARAAPYYETSALAADWKGFDDVSDREIAAAVPRLLAGRGIEQVGRRDRSGVSGPPLSRRAVRRLPRAELLALVAVTLAEEVGVEWDLLVPVDGRPVPVTVWWDEPGRVDLRAGPPWTAPRRAATVDDLLARYGVGPLGGSGAGWEPEVLGLLDEALGLLGPGEIDLLRGLAYWRTARPSRQVPPELRDGSGAELLALYAFDDAGGGRIEVFDGALRPASNVFVGAPEAPRHPALHPILHELGHAVCDAPVRRAHARIAALRAEHEALVARRDAPRAALAARAQAIAAEVEALVRGAERWRAENPVTAAYAARAGDLVGPTRYGRTDPAEGFAEAFALFHLDPEALRRVMPAVHAWFAAGEPVALVVAALPPG